MIYAREIRCRSIDGNLTTRMQCVASSHSFIACGLLVPVLFSQTSGDTPVAGEVLLVLEAEEQDPQLELEYSQLLNQLGPLFSS